METVSAPAEEKKLRRRGWVALLFSFLLPGLGQVYNGQWRKGLAFYLSVTLLSSLLLAAAGRSLSLLLLVAILLVPGTIQLAAIVDAWRTARRLGGDFRPARYNHPLAYLGIYLAFGLLVSEASAHFIRQDIVQAFKIPAASMEPTILVGDHLLVDKGAEETFARGDIVVFEFPEDSEKENPRDFIKRIVGLPGDEIEIRNKLLLVNGRSAEESYIAHLDPKTLPAAAAPRDFFGPITVPDGMYFTMGDNRDRSYDSRFWGFVAKEKVRGKAVQIYWSWDAEARKVRWERIGRRIL